MRIGIIITTGPQHGGTYFYSLSVLNALRDYGQENEYVVFYDYDAFPKDDYMRGNWVFHNYQRNDNILTKIFRLFSLTGSEIFLKGSRGRHVALLNYKLDLVLCPSTTIAAWWCKLPYIVSIHDVWHRYKLPGKTIFIEPFRDMQWSRAARSAKIILVESELGKKEVISAYKIPEERIRILPTGPAPFIWKQDLQNWSAIREKYNLPENYVFYPGGFAPAKNQKCIVEALAFLRTEKRTDIHAILAGPLNSYSLEILKLAEQLGIKDLIHTIGLVPDLDMFNLYQGALSLIMASYMGPTNMPIWEAFAANCPVISSNAGEMPTQVGNAGLLFDPSNKIELADCILKLYHDPDLRKRLILNGQSRISNVRPENWAQTLLAAVKSVDIK
jgi:glycosyltransferase involved in cell wall biosynthesis